MNKNAIEVVKADGEREPFLFEKLEQSLLRAGTPKDITNKIVKHIEGELKDGMSTTYIYRHAFSLLRKVEEQSVAARYSMRRAVFGLGPSGFPFEDYVAALFRAQGYTTESQKVVVGKCAVHEVDMIAHKGDEHIGAEIKFHNNTGIKTDLKVALYVRERFEDLKRGAQERESVSFIDQGMLITNTKFTKHVISYGECAGLKLLSWNYPRKGNLDDMIQSSGIYPITALTTLTGAQKAQLLLKKIVLCSDLSARTDELEQAGVQRDQIETVLKESQDLCRPINR